MLSVYASPVVGSGIAVVAHCVSTVTPNSCDPNPDNGGTVGGSIDLSALYGPVAVGQIAQYYINYGTADLADNVTLGSATVQIDRAIPEF